MKYVIEHDGVLSGPFETPEDAVEYALKHYSVPWLLRSLHILPPVSNKVKLGDAAPLYWPKP